MQHWKVKSVVVVRVRRVADGEPRTHDSFLGQAIGNAEPRRKVLVVRFPPQVEWVAANPCNDKAVGSRIIVREPPRALRRERRIELPTQPNVQRQLLSDLPFILYVGEKLCSSKSLGGYRNISAHGIGPVHQETRNCIDLSVRLGAGLRRDRIIEAEDAARILGLPLCQVVADSAHINSPLEGVVAPRLGPVIDEVDVRFAANPGQACGIANQAIAIIVVGKANTDESAGIRVAQVRAGDADVIRGVCATVGIVRHVPIVVNAGAGLCNQRGRKDVVVADCRVPNTLRSSP